jgi:hypothetical protein
MVGTRWRAAVALVVASGCSLCMVSCTNKADQDFRLSVVPVLQHAAKLSTRIRLNFPMRDLSSWTPSRFDTTDALWQTESEGSRARHEVGLYRSAVAKLPRPKRQALQLLRSSLDSLGVAGGLLVDSGVMSRLSFFPRGIPSQGREALLMTISWAGRVEGIYAERFREALLKVAAAEHLATGSTIVRDSSEWFDPLADQPQRPSGSVRLPATEVAEREAWVRAELSRPRRLEP